MKKISYYIGLALSMILAGCSAEDEDFASSLPPQQGEPIQVTVGMPSQNNSRVSFEDIDATTKQLVWDTNDQLLLVGFTDDGTYKGQSELTVTAESNGKKAGVFNGFTVPGATKYDVYYKAEKLSVVDGTVDTETAPTISMTYADQAQSAPNNAAHLKNYLFLKTEIRMVSSDLSNGIELTMQNAIFIFDIQSLDGRIGDNPTKLDWQCGGKTVQSIALTGTGYNTSKVYMCFDPTKPEAKLEVNGRMRILFTQSGSTDQYAVWAASTSGKTYKKNMCYTVTIGTGSENLKTWYKYTGSDVIKIKTNNATAPTLGATGFTKPTKEDEYYVVKRTDDEPIEAIPENFLKDQTNVTEVVMPDATTEIGANAFYGCTNLQLATLPSTITTIGASAFQKARLGAAGGTEFTLPASVTEIGNRAFADLPNVTKFIWDDPTEARTQLKLGERLLDNSDELETVKLPNDFKVIPKYMFGSCNALKTVDFNGAKIETIGDDAFINCTSLELATLPETVTSIGGSAFNNARLGAAEGNKFTIPNSVNSIGSYAFGYVNVQTITFENSESRRKWTLGTGIFDLTDNLVTVNLPTDLTELTTEMFYGDKCLTTINLADLTKLETIFDNAFYTCTNLTELVIPANVKNIYGLEGATALTKLTVNAESSKLNITNNTFLIEKPGDNSDVDLYLSESWLGATGELKQPIYKDGVYKWAGYTWKSIQIEGTGGSFADIKNAEGI